MLIKEIMRQPFVIDKNISLREAAKIMSKKNIGSLIFVSGSKVKGIITERDLLKNYNKSTKVTKAMTSSVKTIRSDEDIDAALEIMKERRIKRLPVVDNNKLVGIVSLTDIAAHYEALEGDFFFE